MLLQAEIIKLFLQQTIDYQIKKVKRQERINCSVWFYSLRKNVHDRVQYVVVYRKQRLYLRDTFNIQYDEAVTDFREIARDRSVFPNTKDFSIRARV